MICFARAILGVVLVLGCGAAASARQSPTPAATSQAAPDVAGPSILSRLEPDQAGGIHVTEHFAVVFGGIKPGSGIALGPAFSYTFADGGFTQIKAVYSVRRFSLLQARYDSRKFWGDRATLTSRVRWQVAPNLSLYRLGPDSPDLRVRFGERKTEGSAQIIVRPAPMFRVTTEFGIERYATSGGRIDLQESEALPSVPPVPGLGTHPWFAHTLLSAAFDTRTPAGDGSRSGSLLEVAFHDYRDVHDGQDSFERVEGAAQQVVPMHSRRGAVDLSARTWLSLSSAGRSVPFFLMPSLGGGDYLVAYTTYRFRDRHALLLKGEYRWAVHKMVDVAGVYEAGTVAPDLKGLNLSHVAHSMGAGVRVHSKTSSLFSADLAHGSDGFAFAIGFNAGGS